MSRSLPPAVLFLTVLSGCVSDTAIRNATLAVDAEFRHQYEIVLAAKGTRAYPVERDAAFAAMRATLERLGMKVENQDPELGYLSAGAPAPSPLSDEEWRQAARKDEPKLQAIVLKHAGPVGWFVHFEPEGLDVVITVTAIAGAGSTDISLTMRLREIAPPRSGMPRRQYPPPTAVELGLDKIWSAFEQALAQSGKASDPGKVVRAGLQ